MNITPHLGIGDLLIVKMIQISNNLDINTININNEIILRYCENYEQKIKFITQFIEFLFPDTKYCINNNPLDFNLINREYKIVNNYIYDSINKSSIINFENKYSDYIVFHTKMRYDGLIDKFDNEILPELNIFLENFKTSKKIIILGERNIGQNLETIVHKTKSLYDNLLFLNQNNDVIDLTNDTLTCGNPDFNMFLSDIQLINQALCNITFGIGGPFNICKAFSKNNISFIPFYHLAPYKTILDQFNIIDYSIVENIDELNKRIHIKLENN
jgi:hypothetical protein